MGCAITDEYQRRGADVLLMENDSLSVEVLVGKGGDITRIIDKRTDTNLLFESPHAWRTPHEGYHGSPDPSFTFLDHYPGGWQDVLPAAGGPATVAGAPFGLHGESTSLPWNGRIVRDDDEAVSARLSVSLTRYPLDITREITLVDGRSTLAVDETVRNRGEVGVAYSWLQHLVFGPPFVAPEAHVSVPCQTVLTDPDHDPHGARFPTAGEFDWPVCDLESGTVDLRHLPSKDDRVHDFVVLTDLSSGEYTVTNPTLDLGTTVRFPVERFPYLWYWGAFGGLESAPFFGRNYNLGLEPCTSIPNAGLEAAIENDTANHLEPGEATSMQMEVETHPAGDAE